MDEVARRLAERWGFVPTEELPKGYCSRVYADATRALKVPWQGEEMESGCRAALTLSGWLGPTVYEHNPETGSLLMERIMPGTNLFEAGLSDAEAMEAVAAMVPLLRNAPTEGCMPLSEYYESGDPLFERLLTTTREECFLHGDLHHFNLLRSGARWVPIDPKGLLGDPAYECVAFMRNPLDALPFGEELEQTLRNRIAWFADHLDLDPWRIAAWTLVDRREDQEPGVDHPWDRLRLALEAIVPEFGPAD